MARGVNTKANGIDFRANRFDEFLKLIPQNLTDAEKAQVMANLGITPTPGSLDGAVRYDAAQTLTDEQKQQAQENAGVAEALAEKANIDGYYSQLTAGAAENLVGGNDTSREFTEDTAGGTADIADGIVQIDRIKGNTIVWNQLLDNNIAPIILSQGGGTTIDNNADDWTIHFAQATVLLFNFTRRNPVAQGHKFYVKLNIKSNNGIKLSKPYPSSGVTTTPSADYSYQSIILTGGATYASQYNELCLIPSNATFPFDCSIKKTIVCIDLTQMFGAGNEPATPEEFEKLFPLDYYDYNEGELLSLNPAGIKTVGFNAYNHTTGKASVIGGKQYQITGAYTSIAEGDTTITPDSNGLFTPTKNGNLTITGGNSTTTCVHLVWSGVRNGDYEEHWEETRNIPIANINTDGTITESATGKTRLFPDGLCSAGSAYNEVTPTKAIKRVGKVDLGSLNYSSGGSSQQLFSAHLLHVLGDNGICSGFSIVAKAANLLSSREISLRESQSTIYIHKSGYSDATAFKAAMNGVYLYYELETPIEVNFAEPLNLTYRVSDFGTETLLPVNTATPVTTPIRLDVVYGLNVVDFVRNAGKNFVTIEDSTSGDGSTFTNLRSALSTAFAIDIVPTYDATNKRYTFAITDNRKVEVPSSATASGLKGTWAEDATSVYFCTDTNTWVKINKETW